MPSLAEVEARMAPGAFSQSGFLAPGERLEDVLAADRETLLRLKLDAEDLAEPLDQLLTAASASRVRIARGGAILVRVTVFRGFQLCPWSPDPPQQCPEGGGVSHASLDWHARNLRRGVSVSGPGLAVHLIRAHAFFGGQTPYRVDPTNLARLLGIHP